MNLRHVSVFALAIILFWTVKVAAIGQSDAPPALSTEFTYQGTLQADGKPVNGHYDFTFQLYDAATGGNPVGEQITRSNLDVSNGVFSVVLDFGNVFDGKARYNEGSVPAYFGDGGSVVPGPPESDLSAHRLFRRDMASNIRLASAAAIYDEKYGFSQDNLAERHVMINEDGDFLALNLASLIAGVNVGDVPNCVVSGVVSYASPESDSE